MIINFCRGGKSSSELASDRDKALAAANPLPDMLDPISMCPVEKPAISPYGHVLSYDTWMRCLQQEPRNVCPFTKKTVKKRDLVILTWENIDEYQHMILDVQK